MQVSLKPNEIAPQLLHVLIFDLKELKPINKSNNNKRGIRNISRSILPIKLIKKFIPKIGITTRSTNAKENKFFNEVYNSMKEFADIAGPFWSGAQMANAKLGMAHAATLK